MALADYADETGFCFPGQDEIAAHAVMDERSVRRHLAALEKLELIEVQERRRADGSRTSSAYQLRFDADHQPDKMSGSPADKLSACPVEDAPETRADATTGQNDRLNQQPDKLSGPVPTVLEPTNSSIIRLPVQAQAVENPLDAARRIIRAANAGMAANGEIDQQRLRPILASHAASIQQAHDWFRDGIPADLCAEVVAAKARTYRATAVNRQIHSLTYLDAPVREEFARRQAGAEAEALPATGTDGGARRQPQGRRVIDEQTYTPTKKWEGFNR